MACTLVVRQRVIGIRNKNESSVAMFPISLNFLEKNSCNGQTFQKMKRENKGEKGKVCPENYAEICGSMRKYADRIITPPPAHRGIGTAETGKICGRNFLEKHK